MKLEDKVQVLQSENELLTTQITHLKNVSRDTDIGGSETKSDTSSTKAFISVFNDSSSDPSISVSSDNSRDDCVEYDTEGESDFEGDVKTRDEDIFPVIGRDGYLQFKEKSQINIDDEVQMYGVYKSSLVAPLLTPTND